MLDPHSYSVSRVRADKLRRHSYSGVRQIFLFVREEQTRQFIAIVAASPTVSYCCIICVLTCICLLV